MMQRRTQHAKPSVVQVTSKTPPVPLSVIHADALYRPVPPVEYDDEGYPGPDGKVSESTRHTTTRAYGLLALQTWFRNRPGTLVASELLMLFEEGEPSAALSPDLMVVFDAGNPDRSSYKVWREGDRVPSFALEVLSASTWRKDVRVKPGLYAALGIREFWLFEPFGTDLVGHRLVGDGYRPIPPLRGGGSRSRVLGLDLVVETGGLRFRDPATGEVLPDHLESATLRELETGRREKAERQRDEAERRRDEAETRRDEAERRRDEAERQRDEEALARKAAEELAERRTAELEALRARLPASRPSGRH